MKSIDELKAIIADLSEDDAVRLSNLIDRKFGWTGTTFTRQDAEQEYRNIVEDDEAEIPEDYWDFVQDSYGWSRGLPEQLTERGWDFLYGIAQDYIDSH